MSETTRLVTIQNVRYVCLEDLIRVIIKTPNVTVGDIIEFLKEGTSLEEWEIEER